MLRRLRHGLRVRLLEAVDEAVARHRQEYEQTLRGEIDRAVTLVRDADHRSRRDLFVAAERDAANSSARFMRQSMSGAKHLPSPQATLEHGLALAPADGMALEFGVYSGTTLRTIAKAREDREVYGFDSFEGLPEHWRAGFPAGTFGGDMLPEGIPDVPGAELVVGWFDDTLPGFLAEHAGPVAFLHVDADLYSSARTIFEHVGPRLREGSVIVFDEFFNYSGWEDGECRAWQEFVADTGWRFEYEAFTVDNEQVVVRLLDR